MSINPPIRGWPWENRHKEGGPYIAGKAYSRGDQVARCRIMNSKVVICRTRVVGFDHKDCGRVHSWRNDKIVGIRKTLSGIRRVPDGSSGGAGVSNAYQSNSTPKQERFEVHENQWLIVD